jgi:hypothetical protein
MPLASILVGIACGFISAVVLVAALSGGAFLSVLLLFATPLPLMLAGLGWGLPASIAAAAAAALALVVLKSDLGLGHLFVFGIPAAVITNLAFYRLAGEGQEGGADPWYPSGRLLAVLAFFGGAAPLALAPLLGGSYRALQKPIGEALNQMKARFGAELGLNRLSAEELATLARVMADITPAIIACYLVLIFAVNLYLAGRITRASGRLVRSWPDLPGMAYPPGLALGLIVSIVLTFLPGLPALIGICFAGAALMAFFLSGLAVLHAMADGQRPGRLSALYASLFTILGPYVLLIVAALGLAEPLIRLRDRYPRSPKPPTTSA